MKRLMKMFLVTTCLVFISGATSPVEAMPVQWNARRVIEKNPNKSVVSYPIRLINPVTPTAGDSISNPHQPLLVLQRTSTSKNGGSTVRSRSRLQLADGVSPAQGAKTVHRLLTEIKQGQHRDLNSFRIGFPGFKKRVAIFVGDRLIKFHLDTPLPTIEQMILSAQVGEGQ